MLKRALLASTFLAGLTINSWAQTSTAQMGITKQETYPRLWTLDPTNTWIPLAQMDPITHNISMYSSLGFSFNAATLKGDAYWGWNDATYNSGGAILTSVARACSSADVNKIVVSAGGGISGAPYHGKVTSCGAGNIYNLDTPFGWTPSSATSWAIGTDNSAALSVAMGGGSGTSQCLYLPAGAYLVDAASVKASNNCLRGQGVVASRIAPAASVMSYGTTIVLASPTVSPFTTTYTSTIEGVNFFWPGQIATTPTSVPFAYPALFSPLAGNPSSDLYLRHNAFINAYDVFKQNMATNDGALGNLRAEGNIIVAFHSLWDIFGVGEEMVTAENNINTGAYPSINTVQSYAFKKWALQNGSVLIAEGNGVGGGNCSTKQNVYGQNFHNNIINGYAHVIYVPNGWIDESHFADNDLNGNNQILQVDAGGVIRGAEFKGLLLGGVAWTTFGLTPGTAANFNILATCANTNTTELNIHGHVVGNNIGGAIYVGGTNTAVVNISGELGLMALSQPALTQSTYFATIDNPNVKVNVAGTWMWNKEAVSSGTINPAYYNGFLVKQAKSFNLSASIADTWNSVVDLSQQTTNAKISISTLVTTGTTGTDAVILPATCAGNTNMMANTFDKQNRYCGHNFSEAFAVQGDQPGFQFFGEPGLQPVDSRTWDFFEQATGDLLFRSLPDSYATSQILMSFNRNGTWNNSTVEFRVPAQFDQPLTGNFDIAGHIKAGLSVISGAPNPTISWQATGIQPTDQHNWDLYIDNLGDLFLRSINDAYAANSNYVEFVRGSGYSLTGGLMQVNVPINTSSYQAAGIPGFTGTKTAGSCVFTISGGIITNVTGC